MNLKVMTFNLRVSVAEDGGNSWPHRIHAAAEAISESGADIVCTQEGTYPMLQDLEGLLPHYGWIGEGRKGAHQDEHCAVFYKKEFQIEGSGHFGLSERPELLGFQSWDTACPRMCTWVQFRKETGESWLVFNTHLDHVSSEAREKGIHLILEKMEEARREKKLPVILAGDFNAAPDSEVVRLPESRGYSNAYQVLAGGAAAAGRTAHEFKGGEAGHPIDYLFTSPDLNVLSVTIDRSRYGGRFPSDHYPVVVRL